MASILDRCVQLITQSNSHCLMADFEARRVFRRVWDMAEYTENPERPVYIRPNGGAFAEEQPWIDNYNNRRPKRPFLFTQAISTIYLTEAAFAYKEPSTFLSNSNKDLFLQFVSLKTKNELAEFMEEKKDFCIFPDSNDSKLLIHYYLKELQTPRYIFSHTMEDPMPEDLKKVDDFAKSVIRKINLDYIWEKKKRLKKLIDSYKAGELRFMDLSSIHYYMEQISEMFIDKKYDDIAKIEASVNFKEIKSTRNLSEILGDRKVDNAGQLVPGYRVYGHFALCCLQFYLLIRSQKSVDICPLCKSYFKKEHKAEKFCASCKKKAASNRSLKHYEKIKKG